MTGERNLTTGADLDHYRSQTEHDQDKTTQANAEASSGISLTSLNPEKGRLAASERKRAKPPSGQ